MVATPEEGPAAITSGDENVLGSGGFPHAARLELDELLEQLIARAHDVQATQGRLRGLLRANQAIASAVDLDDVLRHILDSARGLVDARYAALGVVEHGRLVRFIHSGVDAETVEAIGHLPEGKGLLGRLIDDPAPLRIPSIGSHESSVGFPPGHPPMRSFLGVPIRIAHQVFGNLYLADKVGAAEFSRDDEELVLALAAAAGAAITNATAYSQAQRRQRWQAAMADLSTALLTGDDPGQAPQLILEYATATADCAGGTVAVPDDQVDRVRVVAAVGLLTDQLDAVAPVGGTFYGDAMAQRSPQLVDHLGTDPRTAGRVPVDAGPMVAVPMVTQFSADGVLYLCRATGAAQFDALDLDLLVNYASHAALVLQLSRTRRDNELLRRVDDRAHVAERLQAEVIQRLSRLGLDLQGLAARTTDPKLAATLQSKVDDADEVIRALRDAITSLHDD